jgi:hypothetical protein
LGQWGGLDSRVKAGSGIINNVKRGGVNMANGKGAAGAGMGVLWFIGWLFTIGYVNLVWWKIILGIVVWPWLLGNHIR